MHITDFTDAHVERAAQIAKQNYEQERGLVPALPLVENIPDLTPFAENKLGAAAFNGADMLGFLCVYPPFQNAFGSTGATGVFSPMGANGVIGDNRAEVYAHLYQAAGYKYIGVDFESINPPAYGFWLKYFTAYTHSVVRRIDEGAIANR